MTVVQKDFILDLVATELVSLSKGCGTSGLLDANGDWRDEAVQLVQLIEAYREGKEMSLLIASDLSGFRLMSWDESTERGLKALYFAEGWKAYRQALTNYDAPQVTLMPGGRERTDEQPDR